jgi:hypothetical protein
MSDRARRAAVDRHPRPRTAIASGCETTPPAITGPIRALCDDLGTLAPLYLDVSPAPEARFGWCSGNVLGRCRAEGGTPVYGWLVWEERGLYINLANSRVH